MRAGLWSGWSVALMVMALPVTAQQAQPSLEQVLGKVQENYAQYLKTLPNLYAQESLLSDVTFDTQRAGVQVNGQSSGGTNQHVAYDSVYRLRRVAGAADEREMEETREVTAVDHKPVRPGQKVVAPYLVVDSEYAPNVFWPGWGRCFDYKLGASRRWQGKTVWVLEYATGKSKDLTDKCPLTEPVEGRALVDPETMTMVRFEQTRPKHSPDSSTIQKLGIKPEATGVWRWSIDYAPVTLEGKKFQLPAKITSTFTLMMTPHAFEAVPHVLWSAEASYSKYQLADVHSKILLLDGTAAPEKK